MKYLHLTIALKENDNVQRPIELLTKANSYKLVTCVEDDIQDRLDKAAKIIENIGTVDAGSVQCCQAANDWLNLYRLLKDPKPASPPPDSQTDSSA